MSVQLNHTIVNVKNKIESGRLVAEILGLPEPKPVWKFFAVKTDNGVNLDFCDYDEKIEPMHYAFLVGDKEFDECLGRIKAKGIPYWADAMQAKPGEINTFNGGRGCYFCEPSGHLLEIITQPYSGS